MASQIGGGTDAFRAATGARTVPLFRPPYGSTDSRVAAVAGSEGFRYLVLWDVDPRDWAGGSAAAIADHVVSHAHNGAIVVMHLSGAAHRRSHPQHRLRAAGQGLRVRDRLHDAEGRPALPRRGHRHRARGRPSPGWWKRAS